MSMTELLFVPILDLKLEEYVFELSINMDSWPFIPLHATKILFLTWRGLSVLLS